MKTVILAILLLVVVSQGEALRCNCGGTARCSGRVQDCYGNNQACASFILQSGSSVSYFKRCMKESDCRIMSSYVSGSCCSTDLCN
ncbi:hypothetical protein VZT92_011843 [Zoarces viviparus]|uniref:Uncharacterized protein n=1 Tax=Zoarces viviparus TaxID=48416 RepID=A0AAW1F764_ZOAVI